jgi:hypothetical protein
VAPFDLAWGRLSWCGGVDRARWGRSTWRGVVQPGAGRSSWDGVDRAVAVSSEPAPDRLSSHWVFRAVVASIDGIRACLTRCSVVASHRAVRACVRAFELPWGLLTLRWVLLPSVRAFELPWGLLTSRWVLLPSVQAFELSWGHLTSSWLDSPRVRHFDLPWSRSTSRWLDSPAFSLSTLRGVLRARVRLLSLMFGLSAHWGLRLEPLSSGSTHALTNAWDRVRADTPSNEQLGVVRSRPPLPPLRVPLELPRPRVS